MAEIYNFFGDIWDYLRETYFSVDFGEYQSFDIESYGTTLAQIIIAMMLGIVIAAFVVVYERRYLGRLVRALLQKEAHDEASAKTLDELGCGKSGFIKHNLRRRDSALRKLIRYVGEEADFEELPPELTGKKAQKKLLMNEPLDFATTRFYIPPALRDRAAIRYNEKGSDLRSLILTVLVALVGGGLLIRLLPVLFRLADNLLIWLG